MSSGKDRILIISVLLFVLTVNLLFAGTTGKISGRIVDKETKEPLIGVNVVVKGSSMGAATDVDGFYSILVVPPGIHTLTASMVGYAPVTVDEVRGTHRSDISRRHRDDAAGYRNRSGRSRCGTECDQERRFDQRLRRANG